MRLCNIHSPDQIRSHPLRAQIFETWVAGEITKRQFNSDIPNNIHYYRDHNGIEVDFVIPQSQKILLVEAKSSSTPSNSLLRRTKSVKRHFQELPQTVDAYVVYGGDVLRQRKEGTLLPWQESNALWSPSLQQITDRNSVEVVVGDGSQPLSGVDVLILFPNKTYVAATTDNNGIARQRLHSMDQSMKVYAASPGYGAYVGENWLPRQISQYQIELQPLAYGGSVIFKNATGEIPNLAGRLNPILDNLDRTYLYADNIAIAGGQQQPVDFKMGQTIQLMDALGKERHIRIIDITGRSVLMEFM